MTQLAGTIAPPRIITTPRETGVYSPGYQGVNHRPHDRARRSALAPLLMLALLAAMGSGCIEPASSLDPVAQAPARSSVWYSAELARTTAGGMQATLNRDFANIAQMGIDQVLIEHCDPHDVGLVVAAAAEHQLRVVLPDPVALRYVRTGQRGGGWLAPPIIVPHRTVVSARYIGRLIDDVTLDRAERLARRVKSAQPPVPLAVEVDASLAKKLDTNLFAQVIWRHTEDDDADALGNGSPGSSGGQQTISCAYDEDASEAARGWLAKYHLGLARGWTDGVVFDPYRSLPNADRGITRMDEPLPSERITLIRRISDRTRNWQNLISNLERYRTDVERVGAADLRMTLLTNRNRQCLLLVNPSPEHFARGDFVLDVASAARAFERAVAAPTAEHGMVRPVHHVTAGRVTIPVALPPGEAELYELF